MENEIATCYKKHSFLTINLYNQILITFNMFDINISLPYLSKSENLKSLPVKIINNLPMNQLTFEKSC